MALVLGGVGHLARCVVDKELFAELRDLARMRFDFAEVT
jgi:hypothetical protein